MSQLRKTLLTFGILICIVFLVWMIEMLCTIFRPVIIARICLGLVLSGLAILLLLMMVQFAPVAARDLGQWEDVDQNIRDWYLALMQPDNKAVSCCGESDAYWADSYEVSDKGEYIAIITDTRDDEKLKRKHVEVGTRILIPHHKLKYDQSNPTGHGIVFLSRGDFVYCYVAPGGV
jgi:hypothetical protein